MKKFEIEIRRLKKKQYGTYRTLCHPYKQAELEYVLYHVQGDAYAPASRMEIRFPINELPIDKTLLLDDEDEKAFCDFVHRSLFVILEEYSESRGDGNSGKYFTPAPWQQIMARTAVQIIKDKVIVRFGMGLPALGRIIEMETALEMLTFEVPEIAQRVLRENAPDALAKHILGHRRQNKLRDALAEKGLVAFIENGSILPRESGRSQSPMVDAIPFKSPKAQTITLEWDDQKVTGMGIPEGLTVVAGGGFHGKSTLLQSLEMGVFNHIPGDGREGIVSREDAFKIRSEDGRSVSGVDISNWVTSLPGGKDPSCFSTPDASGSTSQAASFCEALEMGSKLFLVDEDLSAVNLLVRDERMRALVPSEPLIPLEDRLQDFKTLGVNLVMVVGASARYLDFADTLLVMEEFQPLDKTNLVQRKESETQVPTWKEIKPRYPNAKKVNHAYLKNRSKVKVQGDMVYLGGLESNLQRITGVLGREHNMGISAALDNLLRRHHFSEKPLFELLNVLEEEFIEGGLDSWTAHRTFDVVKPRRFEIGAAWNRLSLLEIDHI